MAATTAAATMATTETVDRVDLPIGAEDIIKGLAAEQILYELLTVPVIEDDDDSHDGDCGGDQSAEKKKLHHHLKPSLSRKEAEALCDLITSYPSTCQRTYLMQLPSQLQLFEVAVPSGVSGGESFQILAHGQRFTVRCPPEALPGQLVRFRIPVPLIEEEPVYPLMALCRMMMTHNSDKRQSSPENCGSLLKLMQAVHAAHPDAIYSESGYNGLSPLDFAVQFGGTESLDVIKFLYEQNPGAVFAPNPNDGAFTLHRACAPPRVHDKHHHTNECEGDTLASEEVIHFLLDQNPEAAKERGFESRKYPLQLILNRPNQAASPFLIQRLAHLCPDSALMRCPKSGRTPLHQVCRNPHYSFETISFLFCMSPEHGELDQIVDREDNMGDTPLFLACKYHDKDVVRFFLEQRPALFAHRTSGATLLHMAAAPAAARQNRNNNHHDNFSSCQVVDYLARNYPQMLHAQTRTDTLKTPLHYAAKHYCAVSSSNRSNPHSQCGQEAAAAAVETCRILIHHNPQLLTTKDRHGLSPLDIVVAHQKGQKQHQRRESFEREQEAAFFSQVGNKIKGSGECVGLLASNHHDDDHDKEIVRVLRGNDKTRP